MPDNKCTFQANLSQNGCKESICVNVDRILDSCRDKDCFENVKVHLTDCGAEVLDRVTSLRASGAELVGASIYVDPVAFNRGFYQITVRYFVKVTVEACVANRPQLLEGISVCEKRAILYGGEGSIHVFTSAASNGSVCATDPQTEVGDRLPKVVCETVDPVLLGARIMQTGSHECNCCCCEIPESVLSCLSGCLCGMDRERILTVSLGFFSVLRIERPCQYMIQATEYSVPDKVCMVADEEDPCSLFSKMAFPVGEFGCCTPKNDHGCSCGC